MTVGELSRMTGMSPKLIRRFTDSGLIYSPGRSESGYRLYERSAVWCVETITKFRELGLTIREIEHLATIYLQDRRDVTSSVIEDAIERALRRSDSRIDQMREVRSKQAQVLRDGMTGMFEPDPTRP